jgi:hypothetical protein
MIGIILGIAIYNGVILDVHFPMVCFPLQTLSALRPHGTCALVRYGGCRRRSSAVPVQMWQ